MIRRILTGALAAAARNGVHGLSVRDIANVAGVSRATVYRYFTSREALLECMSDQVRQRWEVLLWEALLAEPAMEHRVGVVMSTILGLTADMPDAQMILEHEPDHVLSYIEQSFPFWVRTTSWAISPVTRSAPAVRAGILTTSDVAEIAFRIAMADALVPRAVGGGLSETVGTFWALVGGRGSKEPTTTAFAASAASPVPMLRLLPGGVTSA